MFLLLLRLCIRKSKTVHSYQRKNKILIKISCLRLCYRTSKVNEHTDGDPPFEEEYAAITDSQKLVTYQDTSNILYTYVCIRGVS